MTTLTDGTIILRPPVAADAPAVAEAARESFAELEPWMPWANADYGPDDAMFWISNPAEKQSFLILDGAERIVGTCGLNGFDELHRRANLGYWVRSSATGRGIATAATKLVAAFGIAELGLQRLEIVMATGNLASRRVAERAGAAYEGVLVARLRQHDTVHDAHSFSITSVEQLA